jgi:hypothetical protein
VWDRHSCPPLSQVFGCLDKNQNQINFRSGGPGCPPYETSTATP